MTSPTPTNPIGSTLLAADGALLVELRLLEQAVAQAVDQDLHVEQLPTPESRNTYRASYTTQALRAYVERVGGSEEPLEQVVRDLLSDLMHLTDLMRDNEGEGIDFNSLVDEARRRYLEEVDGE